MRTGRKFCSKKRARLAGLLRLGVDRLLADLEQRADTSAGLSRDCRALQDRLAALQEGREGGGVIVVGPAVDLGPGDRLILRVGQLQRIAAPSAARPTLATPRSTERSSRAMPIRANLDGRAPACRRHCPASVATSFQLGSRELTSRAKVQTSVTSVTLSGLPSITSPSLVARHRDELRHEAHRHLRGLAALLGGGDVGAVDRDEARLDRLAALLALLDRGLEAVIDLFAEQALELRRSPSA